jgi:hypothetical protein
LHQWYVASADLYGVVAADATRAAVGDAFDAGHAARLVVIVIFFILPVTIVAIFLVVGSLTTSDPKQHK